VNRIDPGAPSSGRRCPGDDIDIDDGNGKVDMQGGEKGTGNRTGTHTLKGKRKPTLGGKWKWKGLGK